MPLTLPNTLTAGTPENVTHVQQNFVEIANAFPVTTANITDLNVTTAKLASGAVTPRKQSMIYHAVNDTGAGFTPFTGLDGNAAYAYEIAGFLYTTTGVPTGFLQVRPNTTATGYVNGTSHQFIYTNGTPTQSVVTTLTTGLGIGTYGTTPNRIRFNAVLQAKTGQGRRAWRAESTYDDDSTNSPYHSTHTIFWNETTTNISSLQFVWPGIGAVINGWITLRALAEV